MNHEQDSNPQPQPKGEPLVETKRSASQAALHSFETIKTGAEYTLGVLAASDLYGAAKDKLSSKDKDSKPDDSKD